MDLRGIKGIWRPGDYTGTARAMIYVSQLASNGMASRAEEKKLHAEWLAFFSRPKESLTELALWSRVTQEFVDALAPQTQLEMLTVKWGPYSNLEPIGGMTRLHELVLGGAKKVRDLSPLARLSNLRTLSISEAHDVTDLAPISTLTGLTDLTVGNASFGSDRVVGMPNLDWLKPLVNLRVLSLPGTRLRVEDLTTLAQLPNLEAVGVPLRARYRKEIYALAEVNPAFRELIPKYEYVDELSRSSRR